MRPIHPEPGRCPTSGGCVTRPERSMGRQILGDLGGSFAVQAAACRIPTRQIHKEECAGGGREPGVFSKLGQEWVVNALWAYVLKPVSARPASRTTPAVRYPSIECGAFTSYHMLESGLMTLR